MKNSDFLEDTFVKKINPLPKSCNPLPLGEESIIKLHLNPAIFLRNALTKSFSLSIFIQN